jgi:hypothetical protein
VGDEAEVLRGGNQSRTVTRTATNI